MRHISIPLAEILDELAKRVEPPVNLDREPVRRLRREDLDAQAIYLELTSFSEADGLEIERLIQHKAIIDSIRGAIALGRSDE